MPPGGGQPLHPIQLWVEDHTGNHSFIQRLLENGYDERPLHNRSTPKSEIPKPECEQAVKAILTFDHQRTT
jgi:hypothetical protein